jgi:hypothetical protein
LRWLVVPTAAAALAVAWMGEQVSKTQAGHSREALEIAHALDGGDDVVLITRATQWGEPQFGKILGFYARPLLYACHDTCVGEAAPGQRIIARTDEIDGVVHGLVTTGLLGRDAVVDAIGLRTPSLVLLHLPRVTVPAD